MLKAESFILTYNDFGKELIRKSNETFKNTKAEIPLGNQGEVPNLYILKRLALITTIYNNQQLRSYNVWPITPLQSELLLKQDRLPKNPGVYWWEEDLALILYDRSTKGTNPKEAKALYESLKQHKQELKLTDSDLESRLLIISPGLEVDQDMPHKVKPIVLPGITTAYVHPVLKKTGNCKFEYGLEQGLPSVNDLNKGTRTLYMPEENKDIGLRVVYRVWNLDLSVRDRSLADSHAGGRVSFFSP